MPSCLCQIENTLVGGRVAMKQLLTYVLATVFFIFGTIAFLGAMAFTDPADPLPESVYDAYGGVFPTLLNVFVLVSVAMTYPLQFYSAVSLLERVLDFGPGATQARTAALSSPRRHHGAGALPPRSSSSSSFHEDGPLLGEIDSRPSIMGRVEPDVDAGVDSIWITKADGGAGAVALRAALVAFTAVVAVVVPSLSDLIDIVGALLAPWLALTIPALLDLCAGLSMKAYPMTPVDVTVASFVLTTSFILAICGTVSVIMSILS